MVDLSPESDLEVAAPPIAAPGAISRRVRIIAGPFLSAGVSEVETASRLRRDKPSLAPRSFEPASRCAKPSRSLIETRNYGYAAINIGGSPRWTSATIPHGRG